MVHAGTAAVVDPRIPEDTQSGIWIEDGTWHRPLATYELAMLQGFPEKMSDGPLFQLEETSEARWREGSETPFHPKQPIGGCLDDGRNEYLGAAGREPVESGVY